MGDRDDDCRREIKYGTAGFRDKAVFLSSVIYRTGLLAALRSRYLSGKTVGVMITASHNPPEDNGAKIIDSQGEMLEQSWESYAGNIANAKSSLELLNMLQQLYDNLGVDQNSQCFVVYGCDTRASSAELTQALRSGLTAAGADSEFMGVITTPQLHYLVRAFNTYQNPKVESFGVPTIDGYFEKLLNALDLLWKPVEASTPFEVSVDCANGVGALQLAELVRMLSGRIDVSLINDNFSQPQTLNVNCGADFVKTSQKPPAGVVPVLGKLYASFDGDADRIMFYYADEKSNAVHFLDGDKIATLVGKFIQKLVAASKTSFHVGVVQTAYANGSSTRYISETLGLPVFCTPTGVKYLHHEAQKLDIGIYFEANGHGTVLFKESTIAKLKSIKCADEAQKCAVSSLLALRDLINQTVGDAISDLLLVISILKLEKLTPALWDQSYTDAPNKLMKMTVRDRSAFKTTDAERRLIEPEGLQTKLDALMAQYPGSRTFVRASGTENVVRIYAEATTEKDVDSLAQNVQKLIAPYQ